MKKLQIFSFFILSSSLFTPQHCKAQMSVILDFDITNGIYPEGNLAISGSTLYGMTSYGGANNYGSIFSVQTNGSGYTDLHNFNDSLGKTPYGSLTLSGNKLFGMTWSGGTDSAGCIFSINTNGSDYRVLLNFDSVNGAFPHGSLLLSHGRLYGMTNAGGLHDSGCIFVIDTNGTGFTDLYDFKAIFGKPYGSLIRVGNLLYGMTYTGMRDSVIVVIDTMSHDTTRHDSVIVDYGCVFSIDTNGNAFRVLLDFENWNGANPWGDLTYNDGVLYGMTFGGGFYFKGRVFQVDTNGARYVDHLDFDGSDSLGSYPHGSLTYSAGLLYGMTGTGRITGQGGIFSMDTNGNHYKNLAYFNDSNGANPFGSLLLSGGNLYGMTQLGGRSNIGVVFSCSENGEGGIEQLAVAGGQWTVYPNPSKGVFTFQSSVVSRQWSVEVYNVLGEQVFSKFFINNSSFFVDLSGQPNGIYFYRVIDEDGGLVGEGKLIIDK